MDLKYIVSIVLLLSSGASIAADSCNEVDNNLRLMDCTRAQYRSSNQSLRDAQASLESSILSLYKADSVLGEKLVVATREAQQAWLLFRDKQCAVSVFEVAKGSPAYETSTQSCRIKMNNDRLSQLKALTQSYN